MDFYKVIEQVVVLLQRHGRVSYRALKRQFDLADEFVADLKDELIDSRPPIADEDGRSLIWTGEMEEAAESITHPDRPEPQSDVEQAQAVQETSSLVEPHTPNAERRQLTVLFCDLVGSVVMSM